MTYVSLSKEAFDVVIHAAGNRAAQVAKVFNELGEWSAQAQAEAPPDAVEEQEQEQETDV